MLAAQIVFQARLHDSQSLYVPSILDSPLNLASQDPSNVPKDWEDGASWVGGTIQACGYYCVPGALNPTEQSNPKGLRHKHRAHHLTSRLECGASLPHMSTLGLDPQTVLPLNMSFLLAILTSFRHPLGFPWVLARTKPSSKSTLLGHLTLLPPLPLYLIPLRGGMRLRLSLSFTAYEKYN